VKIEDIDTKLLLRLTVRENVYQIQNFTGCTEWTKEEVKCVDTIVRGEGMKRVRA